MFDICKENTYETDNMKYTFETKLTVVSHVHIISYIKRGMWTCFTFLQFQKSF